MKLLLLTFLMTATIGECFCQDLQDLKEYQSDIGFNTNFVFNGIFNSGGNGSPFDLMLKKQKTANSAFRFGTSVYVNNSNDLNYYQQGYSKYIMCDLSISIGKEFQKQINKRWIFYYGVDFAPFISFTQTEYYAQANLEYYVQSLNSKNTYGLNFIPFLGIRLNINERLYVATQTNLFLSFNRKDITQKSIDSGNSSPGNYIYYSNKKNFYEGTVNITPASGIFFFYRF
ncbi:MAG: hypothetical protein JJE09_14550 [Bacteroidia bacterium]|nr:hypothetical protein [Bacteroidia bacterium]